MVSQSAESVHRGDLARFVRKVNEDRDLDLSQYRTGYLERRIATRLRALELITYRQYARYLDAHPDEYAELLDTLTINVTEFFRDAEAYEVFAETVVPELVDRKLSRRHRMIRAWSAGCATGEEPYSIAMSLLAALGEHECEFLVSVLGTDNDTSALDAAQIGWNSTASGPIELRVRRGTATLTVQAEGGVLGSPIDVPVRLLVAGELHHGYLPIVMCGE